MEKKTKKYKDVINIIQSFLNGRSGEWDWDDFISVPIKDDCLLDEIRKRCAVLSEEFPDKSGQYCNEEGVKVLEGCIRTLEAKIKQEENVELPRQNFMTIRRDPNYEVDC
jgi:hypothetical protein